MSESTANSQYCAQNHVQSHNIKQAFAGTFVTNV